MLFLPWLFVGELPWAIQESQNPSGDQGFLPIPLVAAAPVPATAPAELQYWPLPISAAQQWIEQHDPGALAGLPQYVAVLQAADAAARRYNLNPLLLLGELGAEQAFLSPDVPGGMAHALQFVQNPWDYGVYPGSPFAFDIGPQQSALGAASLTAQMADSVLHTGHWSWSTFEIALAQRYAQAWQPWVRNTFGLWAAMQATPAIHQGQWALATQNLTLPVWTTIANQTQTDPALLHDATTQQAVAQATNPLAVASSVITSIQTWITAHVMGVLIGLLGSVRAGEVAGLLEDAATVVEDVVVVAAAA
ncbi:hypothetical protein TPY_2666 [Sulfobacillus acidophilus TPY]|nr:hypothetical protein TPY_2666 [Sulfobacillus acidophilus TPY]